MHSVSLKNTSTLNGTNIYNADLGMGFKHYQSVFSFCFIFLYRTVSFEQESFKIRGKI